MLLRLYKQYKILMMSTKYLIAIFLLVLTVHSTQISVGDSQPFQQPAFNSLIKLSGIAKNQSISVNMQWNIETLPYALNVYLYGVNAEGKGTSLPCAAKPNTCLLTFKGVDYVPESGDYWLYIEYQDDYTPLENNVTVAQLTVTGDAAARTNKTLLKSTITLGKYRFHRISLSAPDDVIVKLPYTDTDVQQASYEKKGFVSVYPELNATTYLLGEAVEDADFENSESDNSTVWTFPNVPQGFAWIVIDVSQISGDYPDDGTFTTFTFQYILSYMTQKYTCPHIAQYPDTTGIFRGCAFAADLSKLPCILYNYTIGACQACYTGYTLTNGECLQTPCPVGQYKHYGKCAPNPEGCAIFNDFTKCTQCSTGYQLANGVCSKSPLTCTGRTFFNSATWTCDKVDDKCKEWDTKGLCTSCISTSEKVSNGKCVAVESLCTDKQYVNAKGDCVDADPLCQNFEKFGGKCIKCVWGYQYNTAQAKCVKIVCPTRYVPNDFGKCVKVSELCEIFDARGNCLACIPSHVLQANGVCLQSQTPNPCPARQYLGDDNICHEVDQKCEIYNKDGGACTKCITGFYLQYTGECVLQKQCKSRQYKINNDCHDVSPTCGNYDRTNGKCLNCASADYELYYGLCIPVKTCGVRQWTDNNGVCHDVNTRCNTFNPSSGDCTSCVQGYNFLNGICCIRGQYNVNGECADAADASQTSNNDGCRTYVNGIGCVRCDDGFSRVQDASGFYYCQSV